MAYDTGTYTGIDDAGDKFYAWALTNGWTQNYTGVDGSGKRYHIEKSIGGTDFFFNFKTADGTETAQPENSVAGILVNGSTEFTGSGTDWDRQVGFSTTTYGGASPAAGNIDAVKTSGGTYHFFATATNLTAVFESESTDNDWRMLTIGSMGGYPAYFASGGLSNISASGVHDDRSAYCSSITGASTGVRGYSAGVYVPTEGWYVRYNVRTASNLRCVSQHVYASNEVSTADELVGSTSQQIVFYSPDSFRGNAQLATSSITITKGIVGEYYPVSDIEGVKFINMTNHASEEEIVYDGDTYMLFHIYNPATAGVAFLK